MLGATPLQIRAKGGGKEALHYLPVAQFLDYGAPESSRVVFSFQIRFSDSLYERPRLGLAVEMPKPEILENLLFSRDPLSPGLPRVHFLM